MLSLFLALVLCVAPQDGAEEQYRFLAGLYERGLYDRAAREARDFLAQHPRDARADLVRYRLAGALFELERVAEALPEYEALTRVADFEYADEAWLRVGEARLRLGAPREAREAFARALGGRQPYLYPAARFLLGEAELALERWAAARQAYTATLADESARASTTARTRRGLAWCALREDDAEAAARHATRALSRRRPSTSSPTRCATCWARPSTAAAGSTPPRRCLARAVAAGPQRAAPALRGAPTWPPSAATRAAPRRCSASCSRSSPLARRRAKPRCNAARSSCAGDCGRARRARPRRARARDPRPRCGARARAADGDARARWRSSTPRPPRRRASSPRRSPARRATLCWSSASSTPPRARTAARTATTRCTRARLACSRPATRAARRGRGARAPGALPRQPLPRDRRARVLAEALFAREAWDARARPSTTSRACRGSTPRLPRARARGAPGATTAPVDWTRPRAASPTCARASPDDPHGDEARELEGARAPRARRRGWRAARRGAASSTSSRVAAPLGGRARQRARLAPDDARSRALARGEALADVRARALFAWSERRDAAGDAAGAIEVLGALLRDHAAHALARARALRAGLGPARARALGGGARAARARVRAGRAARARAAGVRARRV
ncbi:MAG: tetratricopeptide repeat protein [Planctomycetes bacterium]|nr:tetratricopeptide repeat protein [Planctomycetota bacterium]